MASASARSAMVLATLRMRSWARALKCRSSMACLRIAWQDGEISQNSRIWRGFMRALTAGLECVAKTRSLTLTHPCHAGSDVGRRFFGGGRGQSVVFHRRRFDVNVDAVKERTRDALSVTFDLGLGAAAIAFGVTVETARK